MAKGKQGATSECSELDKPMPRRAEAEVEAEAEGDKVIDKRAIRRERA